MREVVKILTDLIENNEFILKHYVTEENHEAIVFRQTKFLLDQAKQWLRKYRRRRK